MESTRSKWLLLAIISCAVVILDQAAKALIVKSLSVGGAIPVFPGFFDIVHVQNPGGAFGFFSAGYSDAKRLFFLAGSIVASGVLLHLYRKLPPGYPFLYVGISLILGGAVGNFIDRARSGSVVDFLDFYWKSWHWPAFNVADAGVTVGVGIFIFYLVFRKIPD